MKTRLTKEQNIHLIKLGVPVEKASEQVYEEVNDSGRFFRQPSFTLTDLLKILPKWIDTRVDRYSFAVQRTEMGKWVVGFRRVAEWVTFFKYPELIDSLYELVCWYYSEYLNAHAVARLKY